MLKKNNLTVFLKTVLSQNLEILPRHPRTRDPSTRVVKGTARVFFPFILNSLFIPCTYDDLYVLNVLLLLLLWHNCC